MKTFLVLLISFVFSVAAYSQNEQAPIVEKSIEYKDWSQIVKERKLKRLIIGTGWQSETHETGDRPGTFFSSHQDSSRQVMFWSNGLLSRPVSSWRPRPKHSFEAV